jgi:hypothetical protein
VPEVATTHRVALGDIGTDFPLLVGMILASGLDAASVLFMFGAMQVLRALTYRMPMPMKPLKAAAVLVISQRLTGNVIYGAGLAIGVVLLVLTATRALDWLARVIPKIVVRGIQFGLGVQRVQLALRQYIPGDGPASYALAGIGSVVAVVLLGNHKVPAALALIALGVRYALVFRWNEITALPAVAVHLPQWHVPVWSDIAAGFLVLAVPQIPLSLGNSILATRQVAHDFSRPPHLCAPDRADVLADEPHLPVVRRRAGLSGVGRHGRALRVWRTHRRVGGDLRWTVPGTWIVFSAMGSAR